MNMQPSEYKNKRKYAVKSINTEDYSEKNKRPKEEFAKAFLRAYDGALKSVESGKNRGRKARDVVAEMIKYAEENEEEKSA